MDPGLAKPALQHELALLLFSWPELFTDRAVLFSVPSLVAARAEFEVFGPFVLLLYASVPSEAVLTLDAALADVLRWDHSLWDIQRVLRLNRLVRCRERFQPIAIRRRKTLVMRRRVTVLAY